MLLIVFETKYSVKKRMMHIVKNNELKTKHKKVPNSKMKHLKLKIK